MLILCPFCNLHGRFVEANGFTSAEFADRETALMILREMRLAGSEIEAEVRAQLRESLLALNALTSDDLVRFGVDRYNRRGEARTERRRHDLIMNCCNRDIPPDFGTNAWQFVAAA